MDKFSSKITDEKNKIAEFAQIATDLIYKNNYLNEKRALLYSSSKSIKELLHYVSKNMTQEDNNDNINIKINTILQKVQNKSVKLTDDIQIIKAKTKELKTKLLTYESSQNLDELTTEKFILSNNLEEKNSIYYRLNSILENIKDYYYLQENVREIDFINESIQKDKVKQTKNTIQSLKQEYERAIKRYNELKKINGYSTEIFNTRFNQKIHIEIESLSSNNSNSSSDTDYSIDDELSEYSDSKNSSNVLSFNSSEDQSKSNDEYILEQKHPPIFNGNYKEYILYEELKGIKENIKSIKNKNKKLRQSIIKYKEAEKEMKANIKKLNEVIKFSSFAYMEKKGKQRKKGVVIPKSTSIIPFVNPLKS